VATPHNIDLLPDNPPDKDTGDLTEAIDMNTLFGKIQEMAGDEIFGDATLWQGGVNNYPQYGFYANGEFTVWEVSATSLIQASTSANI
jgi:hypothetical protein